MENEGCMLGAAERGPRSGQLWNRLYGLGFLAASSERSRLVEIFHAWSVRAPPLYVKVAALHVSGLKEGQFCQILPCFQNCEDMRCFIQHATRFMLSRRLSHFRNLISNHI